jgi:hypothetical protein
MLRQQIYNIHELWIQVSEICYGQEGARLIKLKVYSLSNALPVPTVCRVSSLCETLVGTQWFSKVGIEPTTLGQTGQEMMQLSRQAVLFTAAPCPLQRPSVAVTCGHKRVSLSAASQGQHEQMCVHHLTSESCVNRLGNLQFITFHMSQITLASRSWRRRLYPRPQTPLFRGFRGFTQLL